MKILCFDTYSVSTAFYNCIRNQGLHDQVEALKWVKTFISHFGGNKDNVTIMGESAGAMSCFLHYTSPLSRGLFHKVIALSGSATTPFMHNDRQPSMYARKLAQSFGSNIEDSQQNLIEKLQAIPAEKLCTQTLLFKDWDIAFPMPWKPVIDSYASRPFMPMTFADAIETGNFDKTVPILAGIMGEEGLIITAPFHKSSKRWELFFREWEKWAPLLFYNRETELVNENDITVVNKLFEHTFPTCSNDPTQNKKLIPPRTEVNLKKIEEICTTAFFHAPLSNDLEKLVNAGVSAFTFQFSYQGSFSMVDIFRLSTAKLVLHFMGRFLGIKLYRKKIGACHADACLYIFPKKKFPKTLITETDIKVSSSLTRYLTNFAKFSNPTPENEVNGLTPSFIWPSLKSGDNSTVKFEKDGNITIGKDEFEQRNKFWNHLQSQISFTTSEEHVEKLQDKIAEFRDAKCCNCLP